jgi:hypothetical protein
MNLATAGEYALLGETLKINQTLLLLDLSNNSSLDENLEFHTEITDSLINCPTSKLRKIRITAPSVDVKAHYLELIDQKPNLLVYNQGKLLEDVDVQEDE